MIGFLGRMLRAPPRLRPLRFDVLPDDPATSRFSVPYGGLTYHVHDRQHRMTDPAALMLAVPKAVPDRTGMGLW